MSRGLGNTVFVILPRKGDLKQCNNYRPMQCGTSFTCKQSSLGSHIGPYWKELRQKQSRKLKTNKQDFGMVDEQHGRWTRDKITNQMILMQIAHGYMCFVSFRDFQFSDMWKTLGGYNGDGLFNISDNILSDRYYKQQVKDKVASYTLDWLQVKKEWDRALYSHLICSTL